VWGIDPSSCTSPERPLPAADTVGGRRTASRSRSERSATNRPVWSTQNNRVRPWESHWTRKDSRSRGNSTATTRTISPGAGVAARRRGLSPPTLPLPPLPSLPPPNAPHTNTCDMLSTRPNTDASRKSIVPGGALLASSRTPVPAPCREPPTGTRMTSAAADRGLSASNRTTSS